MVKKTIEMCDLLKETRLLYEARHRSATCARVSRETGLSIGWVGDFLKYNDPSVNKVVVLNKYLKTRFAFYNRGIKELNSLSPSI